MPLSPPSWPRWVRISIALAVAPLVGLMIGTLNGKPVFGSLLLMACVALPTGFSEWQRYRDRKRYSRRDQRTEQ